MPRTYPRIVFGLYAFELKQDATFSATDKQTFSNLTDLKKNTVTSKPYATYEPDYWLLDGNYKFKPNDNTHVGLWSLSQSNASGVFSVPPQLTITFGSVQSSDGLTLRFASASNDFADDIDVAYYNASNVLIRTDNYTPTSWEFSTGQAVASFKKIIVTFNSTNKAYRYLRLTGVDFGELIVFEGSDILEAQIVEEISPLSTELPVGTFDFTIFSNDEDFNIFNPAGVYTNLQENQPIDVYEFIDNEMVYVGQYFLKTWENVSEQKIKFTAVNQLGLLDKLPYYGTTLIQSARIDYIIDEIFINSNVSYEVDSELSTVYIQGKLDNGSYREVLQQALFAGNAFAKCSGSNIIEVIPSRLAADITDYDHIITTSGKGINSSLELKPIITGVEITGHSFSADILGVTFFDQILEAGEYIIVYSKPTIFTSATGCTILESGDNYNYIKINVASTGAVTLIGDQFTEFITKSSVYNDTLPDSVRKNTVAVDGSIAMTNIDTLTQSVYDYYQQRYIQKTKVFGVNIKVGESVLIDTFSNRQIGGFVEYCKTDLVKGFVSELKIVGDVVPL